MNKPDDADKYNWHRFKEFLKEQKRDSFSLDEILTWWECWKAGFIAGANAYGGPA